MNNRSNTTIVTTILQLVLAVAFVVLGVAATRFGTYLECAGGG